MNNQRLYRANSFIRARKERAVIALIKYNVFLRKHSVKTLYSLGSFLTIPNAFKQCTITLLIIHSAFFNKVFKYIHPVGLGFSLEPLNP
jgi:hypothetical protein